MECYLAVNPKDSERYSQFDITKGSQRSTSILNDTFGSAFSNSMNRDVVSIVYLSAAESDAMFKDTLVSFEKVCPLSINFTTLFNLID